MSNRLFFQGFHASLKRRDPPVLGADQSTESRAAVSATGTATRHDCAKLIGQHETTEWMRTRRIGAITSRGDFIYGPAGRTPENPQLDSRRIRRTRGHDRSGHQLHPDQQAEALVWPCGPVVRHAWPDRTRAGGLPGRHGGRGVTVASCHTGVQAGAKNQATLEWSDVRANGTVLALCNPMRVPVAEDHGSPGIIPAGAVPIHPCAVPAPRLSPLPQRSDWRMPSRWWSGRSCPSGELRTLVARIQAGKTRQRRFAAALIHALIVPGPR